MKIDIFGSCISRDSFNFKNSSYSLGHYFARSSMVSAVSNPLNIEFNDIKLDSKFNKNMVYNDLTKTHQKYLKSPENNILLIDIFEERLQIAKHSDTLFTFSREFQNSKIDIGYSLLNHEDKLLLLNNRIQEIVSLFSKYDLVILNKVKPTLFYYDNNSNKLLHQNLNDNAKFLLKNSDLIFDLLESNIQNLLTIELNGFFGTSNHRWGLSPFHYEDDFYIKLNDGIKHVIETKKNFYFDKL
ncbi:hypothetical protein EVU91_13240 [Macrococcoides bohemicum]|uniref:DUF6270 domain-containing protein n=1 Tax=Macrococcoides bohemicum TaxID=1903056 RepID=UPI0010592609|nr:DUF6270 domain-containing protein [Macrococcus bohemicus]TDL33473.1 hypothetical protein EVU91_13240 [Macrococcus bohemicus]